MPSHTKLKEREYGQGTSTEIGTREEMKRKLLEKEQEAVEKRNKTIRGKSLSDTMHKNKRAKLIKDDPSNSNTFDDSDEFEDSLKKLPFDWQFQTPKIATETKGAVCISGKLSSFKTKAEATKALSYAGYVVKTSLTKDVIFLVNESGIESAKTKEARERGITIITSLNEWIGD